MGTGEIDTGGIPASFQASVGRQVSILASVRHADVTSVVACGPLSAGSVGHGAEVVGFRAEELDPGLAADEDGRVVQPFGATVIVGPFPGLAVAVIAPVGAGLSGAGAPTAQLVVAG